MIISQKSHHENVKYRLRVSGITFASIGRELNVAASTVAAVSAGRGRSRRIEAVIASKLGIHPSALWPERYACQMCGAKLNEVVTRNSDRRS